MVDIADVIYVHSEYYWQRQEAGGGDTRLLPVSREAKLSAEESGTSPGGEDSAARAKPDAPILFGEREGRIALANRKKDPLFLFSSLNRQLGYPQVPRVKPADKEQALLPQLARRLEQLESRLKLLEEEQRGGLDLTKFYQPPPGAPRLGPGSAERPE
jgi:hypothetical protein